MDTTTADPHQRDLPLLIAAREACRSGRARQIRQAADLSLSEVGEACGVSESAVAHWESGLRRPTGARALRYALVLEQIEASLADNSTPERAKAPRAKA